VDVTVEHFLDADEPDENGMHSYYYEGDNYFFRDLTVPVYLSATIYADEAEVAYMGGTLRQVQSNELLGEVVAYLQGIGVREFRALGGESGGYKSFDVIGEG